MLDWEYDAEAEKRVLRKETEQIGEKRGKQIGEQQGVDIRHRLLQLW